MAFIKGRKPPLKASRGFTLVELLVVISILGVLAAVVVLNVIGFVGEGKAEAKAVELKQVHTAAGAYLFEGNIILAAITVGPGDLGDLDEYLIGDLKYYWTIDPDGSVHEILYGSSLNNLDGFSVTGSWTPVDGGITSDGEGSLLATGGDYNDFIFQTTATFSSDDGYGMYYRSNSDASDGYLLQFDPDQHAFVVLKLVDGVGSTIATMDMPAGFSGTHSISVSVSGSTHTINVDGTTMSFDDSTYSSGTVGLQSGAGSNVNFTGFTVSPP